MLKALAVVSVLLTTIVIPQLCHAEIKVYETTDNTGINKKEQIDVIEKYLTDFSSQLKTIEAKLDANSLKIKSMETSISAIKDTDIKKIHDQLSEKKATVKTESQKEEANEIEKLKADVLALKNNDIEPLREDVNTLRFSVKNLQSILKVPQK
ncbi:MAG: hypothetical protein H7336_12560 [Bacteriovorax sp.]|nr:hypothetical protein [Bacteriovorax sp.]